MMKAGWPGSPARTWTARRSTSWCARNSAAHSRMTSSNDGLAPSAPAWRARRRSTSRVLGLVRDQVLAALFGAGNEMDAFIVAFRIPNLVRDLFAEGAMSAAFVPTFTRHLTLQRQSATRGASATTC